MTSATLRVFVTLLLLSGGLAAQTPSVPSTSGNRLEQLVAQEQAALDADDAPLVLASGKQLGSFALQLLGSLYTKQGNCELAGQTYHAALSVDDAPEDRTVHIQTALQALAADLCANHPDAATAMANQVVRLAGDTAQVRLQLANTRHAADDLPGTIAELSHAVALDPQYSPAHLASADAFWELNEYQYNPDTLREFVAAQRLTPEDFYANQGLGSVLSQYERYAEAATYLQKAVAADPASPDPWLQLGMNAYAQSHLEEAAIALNKAIALTGLDEARNGYQIRRANAALSRVEDQQGDAANAKVHALREASLHTQMLRAGVAPPLTESTGIAGGHAQKVAVKAALPIAGSQAMEQQHELEQRLKVIVAKSLNDAGTVLARSRNYGAALPLFRIASTSDPDLEPVMRNLGLAAFHMEAFDTAVPALTRALALHPGDALVRADLEQSRGRLSSPASASQP